MLTSTDRLFESGCEREKKEKICRSRGGESCAFDGAMIVLQPIADAAHIVHGPIACCGNSWEGRGTLSSNGNFHKMGFTTDMTEMDIIYGSEEKLYNAILQTYESVKPKAIFVYATCVSGLIGEDIEAVCKKAEADIGIRVIPVNAPGFVGPKNLGNRIAGEALLDYVIGTGEPPSNPPIPPLLKGGEGGLFTKGGNKSRISREWNEGGIINLIGEYNIAGDLWLVEPVLKDAGIRILSRITGDAAFEEITYAHRAKLNVVVCSRALINIAREMERKYGIPYIEVSFFGKTEMSKAMRLIASRLQNTEKFNDKIPLNPPSYLPTGRLQRGRLFPSIKRDKGVFPSLSKRGEGRFSDKVEAIIGREEKQLEKRLRQYQHLRGKRAVLYTGGVKSWSFISALMDLGIDIVAIGTKKSSFEDEEKMKEIAGEDAPLVEDVTPKNLLKLMRERNADILVAGGRNQYLAIKEGFPFVDVNQERHIAYAGYEGLVNLAEQISNSIRFYERVRGQGSWVIENKLAPCPLPLASQKRDIVINPLKHSQSIGAAIAFQGIDRALPIIHGAQGCTFLAKVLLTKHFREPIALASTKLFTENVVMGSEENITEAVKGFIEKNNPDVIGILTSGLSEVKGDDVQAAVRNLQCKETVSSCHAELDSASPNDGYFETLKRVQGDITISYSRADNDCFIIPVSTPDYEGGLEAGYAKAVEALLAIVECGVRSDNPPLPPFSKGGMGGFGEQMNNVGMQINVLVGSHLTPADFTELREIIESFGLKPIMLPNLSALDGSKQGFSALAIGGTKTDELKAMGSSEFTIAIGASMESAARILKDRFSIEYRVFENISGLKDTDMFMEALSMLSGKQAPAKYERQRRILIDGMRDAHFYYGNKKICVALEPDLAVQMSQWLDEMGAKVKLAVIPHHASSSAKIYAKEVIVWDIFGIEGEFDLLISNSHAVDTARRLGIPLYQIGFPVYKVMGNNSRISIGYRGSLGVINEAANLLLKE